MNSKIFKPTTGVLLTIFIYEKECTRNDHFLQLWCYFQGLLTLFWFNMNTLQNSIRKQTFAILETLEIYKHHVLNDVIQQNIFFIFIRVKTRVTYNI